MATREPEPTYQERLLDPGRLSAEPRQDRLLGLKLGPYVKVVNAHVGRTHFTMRHYLSWAWSGLAICTEDKVHSWGIHSINLGNGIWIRHAAAAQEREPRLPALERGGELYIAGLRAFASLADQAKKYYTEKDWQDDGCARGKALHAKLFKAYGQFTRGEQQLRAALDTRYLQLHQRRLKLLEAEEPGGVRPLALRLRLQARELLNLALAQATSSAPRADSLLAELARFGQLLARLVRIADGLPEEGRHEARRQAGFDWTHRNDAEKFVTATKLFARKLKARETDTLLAGRAVTLTDKDWGDRQGSIGLVVEAFNELNENGPGGGVIYIPRAWTVQQVPRGR